MNKLSLSLLLGLSVILVSPACRKKAEPKPKAKKAQQQTKRPRKLMKGIDIQDTEIQELTQEQQPSIAKI